jgi:hypothetical protein
VSDTGSPEPLVYLSIPSLQNTSTEKSKTTLQLGVFKTPLQLGVFKTPLQLGVFKTPLQLGVSKTPLHDSTPPFSTCPERTVPIRTKHYKVNVFYEYVVIMFLIYKGSKVPINTKVGVKEFFKFITDIFMPLPLDIWGIKFYPCPYVT